MQKAIQLMRALIRPLLMRQVIFILVLSSILFPLAVQQGLISDQNLKKAGAGGTLSEGTGAGLTGPRAGTAAAQGGTSGTMGPEETSLANDLILRYHARLAVVEGLELRLANFDRQLAEASTDPHYKNYTDSPQNRAPGVVDPAQRKRDLLAGQLEAEQAKLKVIRDEARRAGVTLSEPATQPAAPSPRE